MNLLSLHHLYIYHTFIDILKLLKYRIPISIFELFKSSPRDVNIRLLVPRVKLDLTKVNFLFQASCILTYLNYRNIEFLYQSLNYLKVVHEMSIYVYLYLGLN